MLSPRRTASLTALAILAFAGNSVLCRAALGASSGGAAIDAASFTLVRIAAGVLVLLPLLLRGGEAQPAAPGAPEPPRSRGAWIHALGAGLALLVYAAAFSFSYTSVPTGPGALLLFGCVQLTMLAAARIEGERLGRVRALGATLAFAGLALLLTPEPSSLAGIDRGGAAFMALSGIAWGAYTLLGRGARRPVAATARNFAIALPGALLLWVVFAAERHLTARGAGLAVASGAACSGLGYAVWYAALRGHSAISASISQLVVPLLAATLGVLLLNEPLTQTLVLASVLVIAGVALALRRGTS